MVCPSHILSNVFFFSFALIRLSNGANFFLSLSWPVYLLILLLVVF